MLVSAQPTLLVAHPSLPVKSVKDLIRLATAQPGKVFYCSSGNGSAPHLSAALFTGCRRGSAGGVQVFRTKADPCASRRTTRTVCRRGSGGESGI